MRLILEGHDCRYALEQVMLVLFPEEKPVFSDAAQEEGSTARSRMTRTSRRVTVSTELFWGGAQAHARACENIEGLSGHELSRSERFAVKRSFYMAAVRLLGAPPPWGALTGIRPAKLAAGFLEKGMTPAQAESALRRKFFVSPERAALCVSSALCGIELKNRLAPNEVSLYLGIPFCPSRCAYCTFVSHSVDKAKALIPDYLDALMREMQALSETVKALSLRVRTLYVGGGTPTVLSAGQLERVLSGLAQNFDLSSLMEYTVEAGRPDTIDREKLLLMLDHGVTRLSVNPQSLNARVLESVGRAHTPEQVFEAYALARALGFRDINMDLIAGLPSDTPEGFARTLAAVAALQPENLMVHTLALKKGSALRLDGTSLPTPGQVGEMLDYSLRILPTFGYGPYYLYRQKFMSGSFENTGWCLPGRQGLYNLCIMEELHTILSLGAGGVTKLVSPDRTHIERIFNLKYPYEYIIKNDRIVENQQGIRNFYRGGPINGI